MYIRLKVGSLMLVLLLILSVVFGETTAVSAAPKWKISCTNYTMYDFDSFKLKVTGTVGSVSVTTNNKKAAKVKKITKTKYSITGVKEGNAKITVKNKVAGRTYSKVCKVSVLDSTLNPKVTRFIAHRGLSAKAPENTKKAFALAGQKAFYGMEADVRVTKDGKFVCMHDKDLKRMCGVNKKVSALTYKKVRSYKIKSGNNIAKYAKDADATTIASMKEFLTICKKYNKVPYLELKPGLSNKQLKALYKEVHSVMGKKKAYIFVVDSSAKDKVGFADLKYIRKLVKADGKKTGVKLMHMNTEGSDDIAVLKKYGFETGFRYKNLPYSNIDDYEMYNIPITVYTLNNQLKAKKLVCCYGFHHIFTNTTLWK